MNMLVIGNGFDLAHERPTAYTDFLLFLELILDIKKFKRDRTDTEIFLDNNYSNLCLTVREYLLSSADINSSVKIDNRRKELIQELYRLLDENAWYEYLLEIHKEGKMHGKNWIDFEKEICDVISFFDCAIEGLYDYLPPSFDSSTDECKKAEKFWRKFCDLYPDLIDQQNEFDKITCLDFIKKTYIDLEKLIRCLEIYLDDCVNRIEIEKISPNIKERKFDFVLSFNYTAIPKDMCYSFPPSEKIHHIHGKADVHRSASENNIVLGVNEYWEGSKKDSNTNFNSYKKFVQRILKETGLGYKWFLKEICDEYDRRNEQCIKRGRKASPTHYVYIFGHSLDITDGDILKEIILNPAVRTVIFYLDKQRQADQIANLSKVLGQDKLLELTFSAPPTLVFRRQADMIDYSSNE